jgi:hypothetical protein
MSLSVEGVKAHLAGLADNLLDKIEQGHRTEVLEAQRAFTDGVEQVWHAIEQEPTSPRVKAIPRLIDAWAKDELPTLIQDPENYHKVAHELHLFKNSLALFE